MLSTPATIGLTMATRTALLERHPRMEVGTRHLDLADPTDYGAILRALRREVSAILGTYGKAAYYIGTASGTPQMHASWVLLAASGDIPARLLQTRPRRFVTQGRPVVTEIDFGRKEFPTIRARVVPELLPESSDVREISTVIERLGIIGDHARFVAATQTAALLGSADVPVLIQGESGTGKEKIAQLIHAMSSRASAPLVTLNCATIPEALAESTLFGHRKGAFTGATENLQGKFEASDGGTLFLDEIAELRAEVQGKLLRTIEDGVVEPLGAARGRKVNVRLVAATNRDLRAAVSSGAFRKDLYHRLKVGEVRLPPLRERADDIPMLALHFLDDWNRRHRRPKRFAPETLAALRSHSWPGNVRELAHTVERAALLSKRDEILPEDAALEDEVAAGEWGWLPEPQEGFSVENYLKEVRRRLFEGALEMAQGNQSKAARLLGISAPAVFKFLKGKDR